MKKYWIPILISLLVVRFFISTLSYNNDMNNHFAWAKSIQENGFNGFYSRDFSPFAKANYPPFITGAFYLAQESSDKLHIDPENKKLTFALYKIPAVTAETIAIVLLGVCFSPLLLLVLLINPGIFYNTLLWGQTEALVASFVIFSLYLFFKNKNLPAWLMFALALLFKQSAIIFFPLILLVSLKQSSVKKTFLSLAISLVVFALCFIPFYSKNFPSGAFWFLINDSQGQAHQFSSSVNALNFWFLIGKNNISDSVKFLGLSYRLIGILLTGITYIYIAYLAIKVRLDFRKSLILAGLVNFAVFIFMTRVHERHLLPTLLLLSPLILDGYYEIVFYALASLISFYNMYLIWNERFRFINFEPLAVLSLLMVISFVSLLYLFSKKVLNSAKS